MTQGGGWSGFSDEDLRKLKGSDETSTRAQNARRGGPNVRRGAKLITSQASRAEPLLPNQMLSKPQTPTTDAHTDFNKRAAAKPSHGSTDASEVSVKNTLEKELLLSDLPSGLGNKAVTSEEERKNDIVESSNSQGLNETSSKIKDESDVDNLFLDEGKILSMELINMDKFRDQQKMMEELNKKKKAMLTVAIQERQKKAKVEAVKLTRIKQELDKLDQMVIADITVIRNKIEESSREYLEAQKRYDRAEKEFIEAKIDLHKKDDMKNQLTEHLYTIIHQNELRKAKKLSELMEKLEMEDSEADLSELDGAVHLPAACLISPVEKRKGCLQSIIASETTEEEGKVEQSPGGAGTGDDSEPKVNQTCEAKLEKLNSIENINSKSQSNSEETSSSSSMVAATSLATVSAETSIVAQVVESATAEGSSDVPAEPK